MMLFTVRMSFGLILFGLSGATLALAVEKPQEEGDLIQVTEDALKDRDLVLVDFDTDPSGEALELGADASTVYVPVGCVIETSVEDSFPSIQAYVVARESGQSCATTIPPYTGTITIRFCEPGSEDAAATVTQFGVAISYVSPGGTFVEAYDVDGERIGRFGTSITGSEYIGFESDTPIAAVKIVPFADIDPDFAFDNVRFDRPAEIMP